MQNETSSGTSFRLEPVALAGGPAIWKLIFDLPGEKVNKLGKRAIVDFEIAIQKLRQQNETQKIDALLLTSGKPGNFVAGADIEMLQAVKAPQEGESLSRTGHKLIDQFEDLPFPKIAVVDGAAMGGGCELALGCDAIVMSNSSAARIGLPEVLLGLCPGMGGCVRLPRKVGIATALDMILTGKTLDSERALKAGLAEASLPKENFEANALQWVVKNLAALQAGKRLAREPKLGGMGGIGGKVLESALARSIVYKKAREGVISKTRGHYPAPLEAISILQDNGAAFGPKLRGEARENAMKREAQGFGKLTVTSESKNLIRLFFLTELVKKSKGVAAGETFKFEPITSGAVLGAGVMGGGIVQLFADKGIRTRMKDITTQALAIGMQSAGKIFEKQVKKKKINARGFAQKMNLIAPTLDFSGFPSTDVVVEAVVEKMEIKQAVLKDLENHVSPQCVIATNTSSLSVTQMQGVLKNPERFGGMHFFNPVHRMPLVEVIRGAQTSDETTSRIYQFTKQLGKTPIVVKDAPGFLVNRLLAPYLNEGVYLMQEKVDIIELDEAILQFGMPMGPAELIDEVGVDVADKVAHILHAAFGDRMRPATLNTKLLDANRLGKKNGKGFYEYKGREKVLNEEVYAILGIQPESGKVEREEIVDRCILPMINEATRCLEEGIVENAWEVDLGMIMGTGFPPFRGGLLKYADSVGAKRIVEKLRKYERKLGTRFNPSPALLKIAESNGRFTS